MVGNTVEVVGIIFVFFSILVTPEADSIVLRFLLYLVCWGSLVFFPHCLMHYATGRLVGVRFRYYFLGRSAISRLKISIFSALASKLPVLSLKIDRASLSSVSRGGRAVMFISGAAASMILPFFVVVASLNHLRLELSAILLLLSAGNVVFDLYYSPKAGDISRAKPDS